MHTRVWWEEVEKGVQSEGSLEEGEEEMEIVVSEEVGRKGRLGDRCIWKCKVGKVEARDGVLERPRGVE